MASHRDQRGGHEILRADGDEAVAATRDPRAHRMQRSSRQQRQEERLSKLAKDIDNKEQPSIGDLTRVFQSAGSAVSIHNAEIEVVKTGGGN
ncbi:MAG: hypothetical protein HC834_09040 [Rhodospirillales bacterium]|nr:hypothetical protein [Rhodospirillales bacterium]